MRAPKYNVHRRLNTVSNIALGRTSRNRVLLGLAAILIGVGLVVFGIGTVAGAALAAGPVLIWVGARIPRCFNNARYVVPRTGETQGLIESDSQFAQLLGSGAAVFQYFTVQLLVFTLAESLGVRATGILALVLVGIGIIASAVVTVGLFVWRCDSVDGWDRFKQALALNVGVLALILIAIITFAIVFSFFYQQAEPGTV